VFRFGEWGHSPMFIILSSKPLSEQPIEYFDTAFLIKGRHFFVTVLVFKTWCQNVCNRLVWIMVSENRTVTVIAFALIIHQMPTLKSYSGTLWISMELSKCLWILWDETSCASSLKRMSVASISVPCTPLRYQHIGFSHLTIVLECVVNHIMCAYRLAVDALSDKWVSLPVSEHVGIT
jgi:hypothetical protein